jgi:hypothetical protein
MLLLLLLPLSQHYHNNNNFCNLIFTMDPHHLENGTSPLDGFNQNLPPGHGFRSDPPGKRGDDVNNNECRRGKVDDPDEDDDTKLTLRPESSVLTPLDCLTKLVPPRYSSDQESALFPAAKVYTSIKQLREELGYFGNTKGFAITTVGTKLCCTKCPEPKYLKNRNEKMNPPICDENYPLHVTLQPIVLVTDSTINQLLPITLSTDISTRSTTYFAIY